MIIIIIIFRIPPHGVQQQHVANISKILIWESTVWTILWGSQNLYAVQISHLRSWETLPSYLPTTGFNWLPAEADVGSDRTKQHWLDLEIRKSGTSECNKIQGNEFFIIMTVSKSCCFNKAQLTVITKQQRTDRLEYSVVYLIGNEADRWYIWLETRLLGQMWTKKMAFTAIQRRNSWTSDLNWIQEMQ